MEEPPRQNMAPPAKEDDDNLHQEKQENFDENGERIRPPKLVAMLTNEDAYNEFDLVEESSTSTVVRKRTRRKVRRSRDGTYAEYGNDYGGTQYSSGAAEEVILQQAAEFRHSESVGEQLAALRQGNHTLRQTVKNMGANHTALLARVARLEASLARALESIAAMEAPAMEAPAANEIAMSPAMPAAPASASADDVMPLADAFRPIRDRGLRGLANGPASSAATPSRSAYSSARRSSRWRGPALLTSMATGSRRLLTRMRSGSPGDGLAV